MAFGTMLTLMFSNYVVFVIVIGQVHLMTEEALQDISSILDRVLSHGVQKNNNQLLYHLQRLNMLRLQQQHVKLFGRGESWLI